MKKETFCNLWKEIAEKEIDKTINAQRAFIAELKENNINFRDTVYSRISAN